MARFLAVLLTLSLSHATTVSLFAAPPVREPAAVAYLSSLDELLGDVSYVLETGGQPELLPVVTGFLANLNDLKGIDRTRPVGVYLYVPVDFSGSNKQPDIVGFVSVTSIEDLKQTAHLSNQISLVDGKAANRYELTTPEKTLQIRIEDGVAFIAEKAELLEAAPIAPSVLTAPLAGKYDLVVQLRREGVPKLLWDVAVIGAASQLDQHLRDLKAKSDPKSAARHQALSVARKIAVTTLDEVRSIWFGLNISRESRTLSWDVKFETVSSGKVAQALAKMVPPAAALTESATRDLPASLHLAVDLPEQIRTAIVSNLRVGRSEDTHLANVPEPQRTSLNTLLDGLTKTLESGRLELLLQFTGESQTGMSVVGGLHVADGAAMGTAINTLLPTAEESDKVESVTLNAGKARGVSFARINGQGEGSREAQFYGGQPSLYIGAEPSTIWFLIGNESAVQSFADLPSEPQATRTSAPALGQFHLHMADWLGILGASADNKTQQFTEAARLAIKDPERDGIHVLLLPEDNGLRLSVTLDEAFLTLIGSRIGKD
ncbi:MAG: hypothetical protein DWH91_01360 [Planctomycetota bacterium]|nr:MAG: hypothetical protein DWH91_01360 [Planctomycetota bacterium]